MLEVWTDGVDLVDQVFHTDDTVLAKALLDELIVGEWDALLVDLAISTLVDELTNRLQIGIAIGNVWVDDGKHFSGSLGETDEDTIVDLKETKKLKDLAGLGGNLVDTNIGVSKVSDLRPMTGLTP